MQDNKLTPNQAALPYRPCVGLMVINRSGLVWAGRRADSPRDAEGRGDWWQMPQGGIDENEDPRTAAVRELYEETAMRSVEIIGETPDWALYDLPAELIGKAWGGRYRGQKQKWFAMRFLGHDSEISIDPQSGHEREFEAWQWMPAVMLPNVIVPFKRAVYETVLAELGTLAKPF